MDLIRKKVSKSFIYIMALVVVVFTVVWFFWPNIEKKIIGEDYQSIAPPITGTVINKNLKQKIISELGKFRQYGEWPILINQENPDRGDPFSPKK
ncbi:hypothetical protein GW933_02850 [Candidatus Falkowbacteria bacterium]|uniref:Uncharacterized protein n=1 Tax=Candidatus Buchananbacteria bacterium CG10_big_fil_rev_8_21_14_0_10_33_19 TaxID=1974525 RepID=A0A2H0W4G8_9BACT|nr:hypothetical protein [Candidatus Falkowbacteria bacterium]PIS06248.1 MAG: hypothetical protein COT80_01605 [Candidatus Buchananbacteria bacterium CG10_big_fil_rev_8_21_14_0_10_33_19]